MSVNTAFGLRPGPATPYPIAGSASSTAIFQYNAARLGGTVVNDSSATLYLCLGAGPASTTNYTVALAPKGTVAAYYELPFGYVGQVQGIWSSATGNAYVSEFF